MQLQLEVAHRRCSSCNKHELKSKSSGMPCTSLWHQTGIINQTCMQSNIRGPAAGNVMQKAFTLSCNTCQFASLAGQATAAKATGQKEVALKGLEKPCMQMCSRQNLKSVELTIMS